MQCARHSFSWAVFCWQLAACAVATSNPSELDVERAALSYDDKRGPRSSVLHESDALIHGLAADAELVFVTQPLAAKVIVVDRESGAELGQLPAPPGGFKLPFTLRVPRDGRIVVLDSGGFPDPNVPAIASLHEYSYRLNRRGRRFEATLARSISMQGTPHVFTEDFEVLPSGGYVVSDSVIGALWMIAANGSISAGIVPDSFAPGEGIPALGPCELTPVTIEGIPFSTAGNFAPGVGSMTTDNSYLYFGNTCLGGIQRVPLATLSDTTRSPQARAADISVVSARPTGVTTEALKGLAFNRWNRNDKKLYVTDTIQQSILRIDLKTGAREVIARDPRRLDFPVSAQFLEPRSRNDDAELVVSSDQEYRLAALNPLISEDMLRPPFLVVKLKLRQ